MPLDSKNPASLKLNRNEFHFAHAASVQQAVLRANDLSFYALPEERRTFEKELAWFLRLNSQRMVLGHGAEDLLFKIMSFKRCQNEVLVMPELTWGEYTRLATGFGYKILYVPGDVSSSQIDLIRTTLHEARAPSLVILPTTNNPSGSRYQIQDVKTLVDEFPTVSFLLDAVYEPLPSEYFHDFQKASNVTVLGSFSKFFGLPGLRLGFCSGILPESFKMNLGHSSWQFAVAHAALSESDHYSNARKEVMKIAKGLTELKLKHVKVYPTEAPFILAQCLIGDLLRFSDDALPSQLASLFWNAEQVSRCWPKIFVHKGGLYLRFGLGPDPIQSYVKRFLTQLDEDFSQL